MKNPVTGLNKLFDSRVRLGILSVLSVNDSANFNMLKEMLEVTDGNLASHLKALEENKILSVHKGFSGRKTNTVYKLTAPGKKAFADHVKALEAMIKSVR